MEVFGSQCVRWRRCRCVSSQLLLFYNYDVLPLCTKGMFPSTNGSNRLGLACGFRYTVPFSHVTTPYNISIHREVRGWKASDYNSVIYEPGSYICQKSRVLVTTQGEFGSFHRDGDREEWFWQVLGWNSDRQRFHDCTTQQTQPSIPHIRTTETLTPVGCSYYNCWQHSLSWIFLEDISQLLLLATHQGTPRYKGHTRNLS